MQSTSSGMGSSLKMLLSMIRMWTRYVNGLPLFCCATMPLARRLKTPLAMSEHVSPNSALLSLWCFFGMELHVLVAVSCYDVHLVGESIFVHLKGFSGDGTIACLVMGVQGYDFPAAFTATLGSSLIGIYV